jgi:tyrosine-protein kinase Etk/Wzc
MKSYRQALWQQKWLVLLGLTVTIAAVILFNELTAPLYQATATIIYEEPKNNIIPEMGRSPGKSAIVNLIGQLKSRTLTAELVHALPDSAVQILNASAPTSPALASEEYLIRKLQDDLQVELLPASDILQITVTANDPVAAQIIANAYVEQIIAWNLRKRRSDITGTRGFVEKQFAVFQEKLSAAEEALRLFKEEKRMISLDNTSTEILKNLAAAEALYNAAQSERAALEERQRLIEQKRRELAPALALGSSPQIQSLKQQLQELETRNAALQLKDAGEAQPEMLTLQQQISQVKEELRQQLLSATQREILNDPLPQIRNLLQETVALEVNLETYRVREKGLQNIIAGYNQQLQALPQQELALARLIRDRDVNEKIYSMLLEKREELRIAEASQFGQVRAIDLAQKPLAPIKPAKTKNLALGVVLGLGLGLGLVFLLESQDTSLKSQQDIEAYVNLPVLAAIPSIQVNGKTRALTRAPENGRCYGGRLLSQIEAGSHIYEAYRALQVKFAMVNGKTVLKSILVTSANAAEGKTLTAINMAHAFAQNGIKTLLVDCDLRHPMLHHIFGVQQTPGLSEVLCNEIVLAEKVAMSWAAAIPENPNLFVFPSGAVPLNPYELLNSQRMREALAAFKRQYDLVILDSPPLMAATDSIVLGNEVDGVCLVIKAGCTRQETAIRAKKLLENGQTNIIGTILNDIDARAVNRSYQSNYDIV